MMIKRKGKDPKELWHQKHKHRRNASMFWICQCECSVHSLILGGSEVLRGPARVEVRFGLLLIGLLKSIGIPEFPVLRNVNLQK